MLTSFYFVHTKLFHLTTSFISRMIFEYRNENVKLFNTNTAAFRVFLFWVCGNNGDVVVGCMRYTYRIRLCSIDRQITIFRCKLKYRNAFGDFNMSF